MVPPDTTVEPSEEKPACVCAAEWVSAVDGGDCALKQEGCPDVACDGHENSRWCLVAPELAPCSGDDDDGWMYCDDDTPVFECLNWSLHYDKDWDGLPTAYKTLWLKVGYTKENWQNDGYPQNRCWKDLTTEQRVAAEAMCFTQESYDEEMCEVHNDILSCVQTGSGCGGHWPDKLVGDQTWDMTFPELNADGCKQLCEKTDGCKEFGRKEGNKSGCRLFDGTCTVYELDGWELHTCTPHADPMVEGCPSQ